MARIDDWLEDLGDALCAGGGPREFWRTVRAPAERGELGLALAVGNREGVLLSYNPRSRRSDGRVRMLAALAQVGIPTDAVELVMRHVPSSRASTVLGVEWGFAGGPPRATLYLEEVSRFFTDIEADLLTRRLAGVCRIHLDGFPDGPGEPYIWAFDLGPDGIERFKTYRYALPHERQAIDDWAPLGPAKDAVLAGGADGFILQERWGGRLLARKVYRCFDYMNQGARLGVARGLVAGVIEVYGGVPEALRPLIPMANLRPTSIGLRFGVGRGATAYWALTGPGSDQSFSAEPALEQP